MGVGIPAPTSFPTLIHNATIFYPNTNPHNGGSTVCLARAGIKIRRA